MTWFTLDGDRDVMRCDVTFEGQQRKTKPISVVNVTPKKSVKLVSTEVGRAWG